MRKPRPTKPPARKAGVDPDCPQPPAWAMQRAARAWEARRTHRPSDCYQDFVPGRDPARCYQWQFHRAPHVIRAMALGNGAGKTTAAGVECDWWLQHRHPYLDVPKHRIQVIWVTMKYAQLDMLREQLEAVCLTGGWRWNDKYHKYVWPNRSEMYVVSNDSDWGTIQGINPDLVAIDEECDARLWRELQMRRRGRKQTKYVIPATPTKGKRWMFTDLFEPWSKHHAAAGLTIEQAMVAQRHPYVWMWPMGGIEDNPIATPDQVDWYERGVTYGSDAERQVRRHGGFADFNTSPVFDRAGLDAIEHWQRRLNHFGLDGELVVRDRAKWRHRSRPEYEFNPTGAPWRGGRITIYELPTDDYYVCGADFAQGLAEGDFDTACVGRRGEDNNCYQVAEAEGRWGTGPMTFVLYALGWFYNEALIVGEANSMGMACLRRLHDELGYVRLYTRAARPDQRVKRKSDLLGYHKGANDRVIRRLQWAISPADAASGQRLPPRFYPRSPRLLDQLRRYELRPRAEGASLADTPENNLTMGAPTGYFDDLVSAAAGAVEGWFELPRFPKPEPAYAAGTAGDLLKHKQVWQPKKRKGAFTYGKAH